MQPELSPTRINPASLIVPTGDGYAARDRILAAGRKFQQKRNPLPETEKRRYRSNIPDLEHQISITNDNLEHFKSERVMQKGWFIYENPIGPEQPQPGDVSRIYKQYVAALHDVSMDEIEGAKRTRKFAYARHNYCYIMALETDWSLPRIGRTLKYVDPLTGKFRPRDHTTVIHSIRTWCKKNNLPYPRNN